MPALSEAVTWGVRCALAGALADRAKKATRIARPSDGSKVEMHSAQNSEGDNRTKILYFIKQAKKFRTNSKFELTLAQIAVALKMSISSSHNHL